jgi:putative oxidoreductase
MWRKLLATDADRSLLIARVILGVVMFAHGAQHALGWFGGYGFDATLTWMTGTLGFPAVLAGPAIVIELVAPVALIFGIGGRLAALGIIGIMIGAASTHVANGFFMNWFGSLPAGAEGYEYHVIVATLATVIALRGSGALSVDRQLTRQVDRDASAAYSSGSERIRSSSTHSGFTRAPASTRLSTTLR